MNLESARDLKRQWRATHAAAFESKNLGQRAEAPRPPVAVGIAPRGGDDYRIAVRIREENEATQREIERLRAMAAGEIEVKVTGRIVAAPVANAQAIAAEPLHIGSSVAHFNSTAGTLGCFATKGGETGFISNNHVIAFEDQGLADDAILSPGPLDGGTLANDTVATLVAPYPRLQPDPRLVDCAFARLLNPIANPRALGNGDQLATAVATVTASDAVEKIGRTTGRTQGVIAAIDIDNLIVDYASGFSVTFDNQLEIEPATAEPFALPGDSGSVVFNRFFEPVGLLFAIVEARGLAYANAMQSVLEALGVELL